MPLLACLAAPLTGQTAWRMWAAQTGPDQVSLSWDSIPGTLEYRIYLGAPGTVDEHLPVARLSASSRRALLTGMQRLANGIYLLAAGAGGRVLQRAPFNQVAPASAFFPIAPPVGITAEATTSTAVTVSWSGAPGATAYYIGRAVGGSGFRPLCELCSTETTYVDRSAVAGFPHTYTVAAIFPQGSSRRISSNQVTPGTPVQEPATSYGGQLPATTSGTSYGGQAPTTTSGTSYGGQVPTTTSGASYGGQLLPGTTTGTSMTGTSPTTTGSTGTTTATGMTTQTQTTTSTTGDPGTVQEAIGTVAGSVSGLIAGVAGTAVAAPTGVSASIAGPGAVRLTWQASATTGVTEYRVNRRVNGGTWQLLGTVGASTLAYADAFFPITLFPSGPARVSYSVVASRSGTFSPGAITGDLLVQPPPTSPAGVPAAACQLDYQRADNMWAAFGRPDGPLGTETISLPPGQDKVFITDWKYEKTRNDGSNYYGSHLRIATNTTSRTIRLQLRSLTLTGLIVWARTGMDTFWIRMDPGSTKQFQADLMEVFCEN